MNKESLNGVTGTNVLGVTPSTPKKLKNYKAFSFTDQVTVYPLSVYLINDGNGLIEKMQDWNPLINPKILIANVKVSYDMTSVTPAPKPRELRRRFNIDQNFFKVYDNYSVNNGKSVFSVDPKDLLSVNGSVRVVAVDEINDGTSGSFVGVKTMTVSGFYQVE